MRNKRQYNKIELNDTLSLAEKKNILEKQNWKKIIKPTIAFDRNRIKFAFFPCGSGFVDAVHDRAGNDVLGDVGDEVVGEFQAGIRVPHLNV